MPDEHKGRIDSLDGIDLSAVSLSSIRWMYGTGSVTSSLSGRYKTYSYRVGVMTELGDIEENIWCQLAEHIARRDGEMWLVDALTKWAAEHNYIRASAQEIRKDALQNYAARIFDDPQWVSYIPFNRKYRPKALAHARIISIITECCGIPGDITQEQIDTSWNGTVCCPHCGRWSPFTVEGK